MLSDFNFQKPDFSQETLPNTPIGQAQGHQCEQKFKHSEKQEEILAQIMNWFQKQGIRAGYPQKLYEKYCVQKSQLLLDFKREEVAVESKFIKRRKGLQKGFNLQLKGINLIK